MKAASVFSGRRKPSLADWLSTYNPLSGDAVLSAADLELMTLSPFSIAPRFSCVPTTWVTGKFRAKVVRSPLPHEWRRCREAPSGVDPPPSPTPSLPGSGGGGIFFLVGACHTFMPSHNTLFPRVNDMQRIALVIPTRSGTETAFPLDERLVRSIYRCG